MPNAFKPLYPNSNYFVTITFVNKKAKAGIKYWYKGEIHENTHLRVSENAFSVSQNAFPVS